MNLVLICLVLICNYHNVVESKKYNVGSKCTDEGIREYLSCNSFVECQNGKYTAKYCDIGFKYNYEKNECVADLSSNGVCSSECNFNGNKPVKGSRSKYVNCEYGELTYRECDGYFDRFTKSCKSGSKNDVNTIRSESIVERADCVPGKRIPVEDSCDEYKECDSIAGWVLRQCQDCQHFDPTSMSCVWAWKYDCAHGSSTYLPYTTDEPTTEQPFSSTSVDPTSTEITTGTSSFEPTTGTATTEEPYSTVTSSGSETTVTSSGDEPTSTFQPTTGEPSSTTSKQPKPTTKHTTTTITPSSTTSVPSTSTTPTSTTTTKPSISTSTPTTTKKPECTKDGEKKPFQKGDCKDYLECDSGKWVKKTCSWGFDFDINKLECTFSWWAKC